MTMKNRILVTLLFFYNRSYFLFAWQRHCGVPSQTVTKFTIIGSRCIYSFTVKVFKPGNIRQSMPSGEQLFFVVFSKRYKIFVLFHLLSSD